MKIAVIAPHPDDETLGCGGVLLRHRAEGDQLHWIVVTSAQESLEWPKEIITRKSREVETVAEAYGVHSIARLGLPAARLDTMPVAELIASMRDAITAASPDIVYLIHAGDVHTDHHAVFTATLSVLKTFYMKTLGVTRVLSFETLSSTEAAPQSVANAFVPNVYRDITPYIDQKIAIMSAYQSELQAEPMPRAPSSIRALARYRGASVGVEYAEAFMLIREVG
jgi:LmbE family N-acetylglucosaminyl deacetylase